MLIKNFHRDHTMESVKVSTLKRARPYSSLNYKKLHPSIFEVRVGIDIKEGVGVGCLIQNESMIRDNGS